MNQTQNKFSFFLMNKKGYQTLVSVTEEFGAEIVDCVICARDKDIKEDYFEEISSFCLKYDIKFKSRTEAYTLNSKYKFAIGWRWIIKDFDNLIVFHDSLLPRYRGFSPLVSALINKEQEIGVTSLFASEGYDEGDIISQKSINIGSKPLKISEAIDKILILYAIMCKEIIKKTLKNEVIIGYPQDHLKSSYSLWRNEEDYRINWNQSAEEIQRFIYAVGHPYNGASTYIADKKIRVHEAKIHPDVIIENRSPGKVIKIKEGAPVIVCKSGLLEITDAVAEGTGEAILPFRLLRTRFT